MSKQLLQRRQSRLKAIADSVAETNAPLITQYEALQAQIDALAQQQRAIVSQIKQNEITDLYDLRVVNKEQAQIDNALRYIETLEAAEAEKQGG